MRTMNRRELFRRATPGRDAAVAGLTEQEARELAERILKLSRADETEVRLQSTCSTRAARGRAGAGDRRSD